MGYKIEWKQYFPTCSFDENKNRDIALEEYKACCKVLESEERIFDSLLKYVISFGTIMVSLLLGSLGKIEEIYSSIPIQKEHLYLCFAFIALVLTWTIVETFGARQKSIVLAKRKIIVLRRMLGLHYGSQEFLFPKGGVEGSSSPFEIQLKFDWRLCLILVLFSMTWIGLGFSYFNKYNLLTIIATLCILMFFIFRYLKTIQDMSENFSLILFRGIFSFLGLKFVKNMEDTLYMAKLSAMECRRQKVNLDHLKQFAILIEDSRYQQHKGIDFKAMARGVLSRLKKYPPFSYMKSIRHLALSGGSTITQQLFRTLFIQDMDKRKIRRKMAEIILSRFWLNQILEKPFQLEIYINSVRFSSRIHGVIKAMNYFFGKIEENPSKAQSFFLIERISVVSNSILPKTLTIIKKLQKEDYLSRKDIEELIQIYEECEKNGKIKAIYNQKNMIAELRRYIE